MLDKNIIRGMDPNAMTPAQRMTTENDASEDIDEIALTYVRGLDEAASPAGTESPMSPHEEGNSIGEESGTTMSDEGNALPDSQIPENKDGVPSWRDAVKSEETTAFRHERTTERNMKLMSALWNRLFPIDYEAIPVPDYIAMEEEIGGVPVIRQDSLSQATDANEAPSPSVAASAETAGLGLDGSSLFGRHYVLQSDTSNDDTVMIGNAALSEILSQHQHDGASVHADESTDAQTQEEVTEENSEEELPESLTSLYDEAMSLFVEPEDNAPTTMSEATDDFASDFEDVDEGEFRNDNGIPAETGSDIPAIADDEGDIDDVVAPDDAENIQTDYVSDDYRENTGSTNIYESEEWLQIEREIEETNRAVEAGLSQLDALAHVGTASDDSQPVAIASDDETSHKAPEANPITHAYDADDFEDVPETDDFEDVPETSNFGEAPTTDGFVDVLTTDNIEEPLVNVESPTAPSPSETRDATSADAQQPAEPPVRQSIFTRIASIFQKGVPSQSEESHASETVTEYESPVWESQQVTEGAYEETESSYRNDNSFALRNADTGQELSSARTNEAEDTDVSHGTEPETAPTDENVASTCPEMGMSEDNVAEDIVAIGDDDRLSNSTEESSEPLVGTDYRQSDNVPEDVPISPDDTFFGMDPVDIEADEDARDDIIEMLDDDEQPHDYRAQADALDAGEDAEPDTSSPTMPMPQEELLASEAAVVPQTELRHPEDRDVRSRGSVPQQEIRRIDKARLNSLLLDASPDLMLPLPTSRNGQINANIKIKTTEFLNPKKIGAGARSSYIKLSVRPSKVRMSSVTLLPEGSGYVPEESPMGTRLREQARYEYEPIRRIGEAIDA